MEANCNSTDDEAEIKRQVAEWQMKLGLQKNLLAEMEQGYAIHTTTADSVWSKLKSAPGFIRMSCGSYCISIFVDKSKLRDKSTDEIHGIYTEIAPLLEQIPRSQIRYHELDLSLQTFSSNLQKVQTATL